MEDKTPIDAIHRLMPEIRECQTKLKTLRDQARDTLQSSDEYKQLQEQAKSLAEKRAAVKRALLDEPEYQKLTADLDDERIKLRDLQEILSHYLVSYYRESESTDITDDLGENKQVIISAKIGKPE